MSSCPGSGFDWESQIWALENKIKNEDVGDFVHFELESCLVGYVDFSRLSSGVWPTFKQEEYLLSAGWGTRV